MSFCMFFVVVCVVREMRRAGVDSYLVTRDGYAMYSCFSCVANYLFAVRVCGVFVVVVVCSCF